MNFVKTSVLSAIAMAIMLFTFTTPLSARTTEVTAAQQRVISVTTRIVNLLEQNKAVYEKNQNALNTMIKHEVLPFIDFNAMSKLTLGKHWRKASPQQRSRFINAFREMLIRSYAKTMLKYTGAKIRGGNSRANKKPGYVLVRTVVTPKGSATIRANYSLRKLGNDWKAYNVEIAGINLITNFRTNFTREVSSKGLNALIKRLEKSAK